MTTTAQAMRRLHDDHQGLTPSLVLDTARDPGHVLHRHFNWDDTDAAERYRLDQARALIRSFRVVFRDDDEQHRVRSYVSVASDTGPVYRATEDVLTDDFSRTLLMTGLKRDLAALQRKYGHLEEYAAIVLAQVRGDTA